MATLFWESSKYIMDTKYSWDGRTLRDINIKNWRFMIEGNYYRNPSDPRSTDCVRGVYMLICNILLFIPYIDIDKINKINKMGDGYREKQFYTRLTWYDTPCMCSKCRCHGKFDWINKATAYTSDEPDAFERDERHVLIYKNMSNQFSQIVLYEGESYCPKCHGTGVSLDARQRVFKGMKGLRKNLVRLDI